MYYIYGVPVPSLLSYRVYRLYDRVYRLYDTTGAAVPLIFTLVIVQVKEILVLILIINHYD